MFENQAVDADVTQALLHRIEQVLSGRGFELGAVGIGVTDRFDVQLLLFHVDIEGSRYPMNILVGGKLGQAAAILEDHNPAQRKRDVPAHIPRPAHDVEVFLARVFQRKRTIFCKILLWKIGFPDIHRSPPRRLGEPPLADQKAGAAHDGLRTRCGLEQCLKLLTFRFPEQV